LLSIPGHFNVLEGVNGPPTVPQGADKQGMTRHDGNTAADVWCNLLNFQDYKLGCYLLKKQALYAHKMSDGHLQWTFAEDDVHMAHQYRCLSEQTVRANVGYYSHPNVAHVPFNSIITAFRDGVNQDTGLLDSHLPNSQH